MKRYALVLAVFACGDKQTEPEVSAVNALVPANHENDLDFVMRTVDELQFMPTKQRWRVPAPKSWEVTQHGGRIYPREAMGSGSGGSKVRSSITLVTERCDGECVAPPHQEAPFILSDRDKDIVVDGKAFHQHIQVTSFANVGDDRVAIKVLTWASGGHVSHECGVVLDAELKDAEKAFEMACVLASFE
jgi:hypothetical protein